MAGADYVIVGSGINALVAAALLGRKGRRVHMLERNDRIGGCLRTEEITAPGFVHDVMATTFVLFVTATVHGLSAGTDTKSALSRIIALAVSTVFVGLTAVRVGELARSRTAVQRPVAGGREVLVNR